MKTTGDDVRVAMSASKLAGAPAAAAHDNGDVDSDAGACAGDAGGCREQRLACTARTAECSSYETSRVWGSDEVKEREVEGE